VNNNTVLVDEVNKKHAEHAARARAVAGARTFEEARALGAAHVQQEATTRDNVAAYAEGIAQASNTRLANVAPEEIQAGIARRLAVKAARRNAANTPAAPTAKAPTAKAASAETRPVAAPAAAAAAPVFGKGNFVIAARKYRAEQATLGCRVTFSDAIAHVSSI
jgi:hypothetical protein